MSYLKPNDKDTLTLYSTGLLSKWGFGDGGCLFDWAIDADVELPDADEDEEAGIENAILVALVREYLLPLIKQTLDVYEIETAHNPIRTRSVDGKEVDCIKPDFSVMDFVSVTLSREQIIEVAKRFGEVKDLRGVAQ